VAALVAHVGSPVARELDMSLGVLCTISDTEARRRERRLLKAARAGGSAGVRGRDNVNEKNAGKEWFVVGAVSSLFDTFLYSVYEPALDCLILLC
jgi:hypothetical protein